MAEILYRKWRPRLLSELAGQEHVATTLRNALTSGRIAHAYLFAGPRGTGKTSTGRLLGRALNCTDLQQGEPCNRCQSCIDLLAGRAFDVIELDAASNRGIDEIRRLRDSVAVTTAGGAYKVYLIDEVHMLTEAAFNALLKTLEEPPPYVVFILATTDAHKVPATITSRCQRFDFRRAPLGATIANLQRICEGEGMVCEAEALELIARSATGSHRDAVNLLDQLATSYGNDLTAEHVRAGLGLIGDERSLRLARMAVEADLAGGLELIASVRDDGLDLRQFQRELVAELRALLLVKSGLPAAQSGTTEERRREMEAAVAAIPPARLLTALRAFGEADLKADPNSTLPLDIALAACILEVGQPAVVAPASAPATPASGRPTASQPSRPPALSPKPPPSRVSLPPEPSELGEPSIPAIKDPAADLPSSPFPVNGERGQGRGVSAPTVVNGASEPVGAGLAAARNGLRRIYEQAKEAQFQVAALINSVCDIIDADESSVTFGFRYEAQLKKIMEPANLKILSDSVASAMGRDLTVRCVHDANVESWRTREPVSRSPLVRAAQEMGARVLSPGPEEA